MLAFALGLGSSLAWGVADFLGGLQSRRVPLAAVMLVSQVVGLALLAAVVLLVGTEMPALIGLAPAAGAGIAGAIAITAFYRALAIGTMSIVAPISATGAALPVVVGLAGGERPSALALAGMACAVIGVVLAAREQTDDPEHAAASRRSVALALVAAVGIGTFFVGMDVAAEADPYWAMVAARAASTVALLSAVAVVRPALAVGRSSLPALAVIGVLDASANALFVLASTQGLLSVVAVLGSLYPVVTIALARAVLAERISPVQQAGVVGALVGVALIAAG